MTLSEPSPSTACSPDSTRALGCDKLTASTPPVPGVRWLHGAEDEARLVALLRAGYGNTYGHRGLYETGAFLALWASRRLASLGWFDDEGHLRAHTGVFHKDASADFVESGLSIVAPAARRERQRTREAALWEWLRKELCQCAAFMHQHTTTLHPGAQLYAQRYMKARLCGLIPNYVTGEQVLGLAERGDTMHALMMTTFLQPLTAERSAILLPSGPHAEWLSVLAQSVGLATQVVPRAPGALAEVSELEHAEVFGLIRRRVTVARRGGGTQICPASARVDLIHLPAQEAALACLCEPLYIAGYKPIGLRLGRVAAHEIIWWRGVVPARLLQEMIIVHPVWEEMISLWSKLTAHPP